MKKKNKKIKEFIIEGTLSKYRNGFGFVEATEESKELLDSYLGGDTRDIYISAADMNGALDGDKVEAVLLPRYFWRGDRAEGQIRKVTERKIKEVIGTFRRSGKFAFVIPECQKTREHVYVQKKNFGNASDGDKVVCKIVKYPTGGNSSEGKVTEIIAGKGEKGADIKAIIRAYGYSDTFPDDVKEEAKNLARRSRGGLHENEKAGRRDLTEKLIVTIDGADSKDFDDAVSVEKLDNGNYLLGVHIADVTEYVKEGSQLDNEALKRGNSVYLIDTVVPMLPVQLSNGICSLNPGEERLTLSVNMEIDEKGNIEDYEIYKSFIKSSYRLVYDNVSDVIENMEETDDIKLTENIHLMAELADILTAKRKERGSLDFDFDEAEIKLDKRGVAVSVEVAERRSANRLIEEFMLAANETVAQHFSFMQVPFIYRVHEKPDNDRIEELKAFLHGFGINLSVNADNVHPKILSGILDDIHGSQYENIVSTAILRSMKKAFYDPECMGHFGLSLKYYCHFTSPIRRYPDLMIHRIIKEVMTAFPEKERLKKIAGKVKEAAEMSSVSERKALEIERDVEKLKKTEYMTSSIGEVFEGVISGVSNHGIYVELDNTIEGMIRLEWINDDYYDCEPEKYRVVGRKTGRIFTLGNKIRVKLKNADPEKREIDFVLADDKYKKGKIRTIKGKHK